MVVAVGLEMMAVRVVVIVGETVDVVEEVTRRNKARRKRWWW